MRDVDDTDRELLRLLLEDARRPYSELAEAVDLSPPAVSDRVDRLAELGVIERFTLDVDRSRLRDGDRLAVTLSASPGETATVREAVAGLEGVEHVFVTADGRLFVVVTVPNAAVERHLAPAFETGAVESVDVSPLVGDDLLMCGSHPAWGYIVRIAAFAAAQLVSRSPHNPRRCATSTIPTGNCSGCCSRTPGDRTANWPKR